MKVTLAYSLKHTSLPNSLSKLYATCDCECDNLSCISRFFLLMLLPMLGISKDQHTQAQQASGACVSPSRERWRT